MFGSVNALFAGLAFAGVIYTILLQRKELELQRKELQDTRKEFEQQNITLKLQRFENTFFHMLSLHNDIVEKISFYPTTGGRGRESFSIWRKRINDQVSTSLAVDISRKYSEISEKNVFDHYFRNLYHIYKFVYFAKLDRDEKQFYADIVTAQLSANELACLAYNALLYPKAKYLLDCYRVFSKLDQSLIHDTLSGFIESEAPNPFVNHSV